MNKRKCVEAILEVEEKYDLNMEAIDGFHFWTYARYNFFLSLIRIKVGNTASHHKKNLVQKVIPILKMVVIMCIGSITNGLRKIPEKTDVWFLSHTRRVWEKDCYKCIYTDDIKNYFDNSISLEGLYDKREHRKPSYTKDLIYSDQIVLGSYVYAIINVVFFRKKYLELVKIINDKLQDPVKELEKALLCHINLNKLVKTTAYRYYFYRFRFNNYYKIINKSKPKVIVEVVSYAMDCMIINEIAKKEHIPTMELQHGASGKEHLAYNFLQGRNIDQFPEYFLAHSDYWCTQAAFPIDNKHIISAGFPYIEKEMLNYSAPKKEKKRNILFISQPIVGKRLSEIASQLNRILDLEEYQIIYKLHPSEYKTWREEYPELQKEDIIIADESGKNLYEYLSICDIQVGVYSTAIYEGIAFGLETFIADTFGAEGMEDLVKQNYAVLIKDEKELFEGITKQEKAVGLQDRQKFWKEDALKTIVDIIKSFL